MNKQEAILISGTRHVCVAASLAWAVMFFPQTIAGQTVHYVNADASGSNDGTSWVNAFTSLQDALAASTTGDAVWVAAGTYRPDEGDGLAAGDQTLSFELKSGVQVHGGFAGTEDSMADRDLALNTTVLSGDLARDDDGFFLRDDNSYHVVRADDVNDDALLDGFVIVGGYASQSDVDSLGGGILISGGSPWIVNTRANSNMAACGGGIAVTGGASPTLVNVVLNGNRAATGGAMCNVGSLPTVTSSTVTNNTASFAPGIYNLDATPAVANSIVASNHLYEYATHCEIWQYPCRPSDVPDSVRQATRTMMAGAYDAGKNGSLDDAASVLEAYPDVVEVLYGQTSVAARLRGGAMTSLRDLRGLPRGDGFPGKASVDNRMGTGVPFIKPSPGKRGEQTPGRTIVGEDRNSSGRIDNQDGKRALVLNPFSTPDGELAPVILAGTPGYAGNIEYYSYFRVQQEGVTPWITWDYYDFIYLATTGDIQCPSEGAADNVEERCRIIINTGFELDDGEDPPVEMTEELVISFFDTDNRLFAGVSVQDLAYGYAVSLDNAVVYCAYCPFLMGEPFWDQSQLGFGLASNNFELLAWARNPEFQPQSQTEANIAVLDYFRLGASAQSAFEGAEETNPAARGLISTPEWDPSTRIRERPTLLYDPEPTVGLPGKDLLMNLTDISTMAKVEGDVEKFYLITQLGGYKADADQSTVARYYFNNELFTTITLPPSEGEVWQLVPGTEEQVLSLLKLVEVPEALIDDGIGLLEVSVDVPEGGESWYGAIVTYDAFSCSASATIGDYREGAFTGAAQADTVMVGETAVLNAVTIESAASVLVFGPFPETLGGPGNYNIILAIGAPQDTTGTGYEQLYELAAASVSQRIDFGTWSAVHSGSGNCPECGGLLAVTDVNEAGTTWSGDFAFVAEDITSSSVDRRYVRVEGKFKAVVGNQRTPSSPYFHCLQEYWRLVGGEPSG